MKTVPEILDAVVNQLRNYWNKGFRTGDVLIHLQREEWWELIATVKAANKYRVPAARIAGTDITKADAHQVFTLVVVPPDAMGPCVQFPYTVVVHKEDIKDKATMPHVHHFRTFKDAADFLVDRGVEYIQ